MKIIKTLLLFTLSTFVVFSANYKGIDISHHNGNIKWNVLDTSNYISFVVIKATEKTPVGHHVSKLISNLGYDCTGLDGYLHIPVKYANIDDLTDLINAISKFYNKETVQVHVSTILNFLIKTND